MRISMNTSTSPPASTLENDLAAAKSGEPLLSVDHLSIGFHSGKSVQQVVYNLCFDVKAGECFALLGESGCGKSASALAMMRLLPPAGRVLNGQVLWRGKHSIPPGAMSMIFQEPANSLNPVLSIGRQIEEVLFIRKGLRGRAAREGALGLLYQVGISDPERRLDEYPFQISGGMKQRVMTAMALAGEPSLLIADEPTTALDVTVQAQMLDLLDGLQQERAMAILLITHDLGVAARMAHRVGVMYAGELVEVAARNIFFENPAHPYTRALFAAVPGADKRGRSLQSISGRMSRGDACAFASRCAQATKLCLTEAPPWRHGGEAESARQCSVRCHHRNPNERAARAVSATSVADTQACVALQTPNPLLQVRELRVHFPVRKGMFRRQVGLVRAVDGVSLTVESGQTLALVGESGCGKTTVGKAILRLLEPTGGTVQINDLVLPTGSAVSYTHLTLPTILRV